ncbi:hypothetical protein BOTBODRAFT_175586 [Botryobasidium botryosum FD-172 SS1]|uniref:BTB domain-containing protein n=1 Tax=Botryobasidium botryosum (strain FD-172 SS1) TaxID=930990 RepID=A0A067MEX2_BOTB1|nr:hypothetical protein BOTBODRAFT_175586 [Botryobasidium botryosum FD-172 SS1]
MSSSDTSDSDASTHPESRQGHASISTDKSPKSHQSRKRTTASRPSASGDTSTPNHGSTSISDNNNQKRAKMESNTPVVAFTGAKHEKFWFDDGNVIIRVEDWHFRVYSALLRSKSVFFAGLLVDAQPGAAIDINPSGPRKEVIMGCRVFELQGKKRHFTALLDALFGSLLTTEKPISYFTLSCLLRAAHRWGFPEYEVWARTRLERDWSSDLDSDSRCMSGALDRYAAGVIVLAQECRASELLRPAFYRLVNRSVRDPDCTPTQVLPSASSNTDNLEYNHETVQWSVDDFRLSYDDANTLNALFKYAAVKWRDYSSKPLSRDFLSDKARHKKGPSCDQVLKRIWHSLVTESTFADDVHDPISNLKKLADGIDWEGNGVCALCADQCRKIWREQRHHIWSVLTSSI